MAPAGALRFWIVAATPPAEIVSHELPATAGVGSGGGGVKEGGDVGTGAGTVGAADGVGNGVGVSLGVGVIVNVGLVVGVAVIVGVRDGVRVAARVGTVVMAWARSPAAAQANRNGRASLPLMDQDSGFSGVSFGAAACGWVPLAKDSFWPCET